GAYTPQDVAKGRSAFAASIIGDYRFDDRTLETAKSIFRLTWSGVVSESQSYAQDVRTRAAREFLEGAPPSWRLASTEVPVRLAQTDQLYKFIKRGIADRDR